MVHFNKALESRSDSSFKNSYNLQDAIQILYKTLANENRPKLLKLDIEESEWNLLLESKSTILDFEQLIIEFHDFHKLGLKLFRDNAKVLLEYLAANYKIINLHQNNFSQMLCFGDSFIADVIKITFIRNDIFQKLIDKQELPNVNHNLNKPNFSTKLEYPEFPFSIA